MNKLISASVALLAVGLSAPARAADMPVKSPVLAPAANLNWTGFYVGGHVGAGLGTNDWTNFQSPVAFVTVNGFSPGSGTIDGVLGGVQLGANFQVGWAVFGLEGQFSWAGFKGNVACGQGPACSDQQINYHSKVDWITSVTARAGGTVGNALVYLKGGRAWIGNRFGASCITGLCAPNAVATIAFDVQASQRRSGWTLGAGGEYAFDSHWSGKIEYDFYDFGTGTVQFPPSGNVAGITLQGFTTDVTQHVHVIKAGLNFRFGLGLANH